MSLLTASLRTLSVKSNIVDGVMKEDYLVEFVGKNLSVLMPECVQMKKVEIVIRPEDLALTTIEKRELTVEVDTQLFRWGSLRNHLL